MSSCIKPSVPILEKKSPSTSSCLCTRVDSVELCSSVFPGSYTPLEHWSACSWTSFSRSLRTSGKPTRACWKPCQDREKHWQSVNARAVARCFPLVSTQISAGNQSKHGHINWECLILNHHADHGPVHLGPCCCTRLCSLMKSNLLLIRPILNLYIFKSPLNWESVL